MKNFSRREILIGLAGMIGSSLHALSEPRLTPCKTRSNDPFAINGFSCREATAAGMTYRLYKSQSSGPAVLLLHELPGLYKADIELGRRIAQCGFTVYMPLFFGKPNGEGKGAHVVWKLFTETIFPWAPFHGLCPGHTSRVARWLNELLPSIHRECGWQRRGCNRHVPDGNSAPGAYRVRGRSRGCVMPTRTALPSPFRDRRFRK